MEKFQKKITNEKENYNKFKIKNTRNISKFCKNFFKNDI